MKKQIKSIISLFAICAATAILLALTNAFTAPKIAENEEKAANAALLEVLPTGEDFKKVDFSAFQNIPSTVKEVYSEKNGGYVVKLETAGYSSGMVIMCGVNADGTVSGAICLSSGETLGYEKTFGDTLKGKDANTVGSVNTVSGATKTTAAYRAAVKDALNTAIILGGGVADTRTEEEILAENLATALPAANGEFNPSYIEIFISGTAVDSVYVAKNGSGAVYVIGEEFIGVDADGNILTESATDTAKGVVAATVEANKAYTLVAPTEYEALSKSAQRVVKTIKKAEDGTLVFELYGRGYGINGGDQWHPASGEPIVICLSVATDGKISKCVTMLQKESTGFGAVCGESSYYSKYDGKTKDDYTGVDAISGATLTETGYKNAIKYAFEAVEILKGGN